MEDVGAVVRWAARRFPVVINLLVLHYRMTVDERTCWVLQPRTSNLCEDPTYRVVAFPSSRLADVHVRMFMSGYFRRPPLAHPQLCASGSGEMRFECWPFNDTSINNSPPATPGSLRFSGLWYSCRWNSSASWRRMAPYKKIQGGASEVGRGIDVLY